MRLDPRYPPPRDPTWPGRCPGCRMPEAACFCAEVPTISTRTRIVIVRHASEIAKTSNTGRMAARALENALLLDHGVPGRRLDLSALLEPDARVLYPGPGVAPGEAVRTLVVLDGSWSHVRGMRWRIPPLAGLRSLGLPAPVVAPLRMRRGQHPDQLATIEAIAGALDALGEPDAAGALRGVFHTMAARMRDLRGFDLPPRWEA